MFTKDNLLSMTDYFDFLSTDEETFFEIMSKNTTHCWKIVKEAWGYQLLHAHKLSDGYHIHGQYRAMLDCVLDIVEHDEWKLGIWRHKNIGRRKQPYTYFDQLVDTYVKVPSFA